MAAIFFKVPCTSSSITLKKVKSCSPTGRKALLLNKDAVALSGSIIAANAAAPECFKNFLLLYINKNLNFEKNIFYFINSASCSNNYNCWLHSAMAVVPDPVPQKSISYLILLHCRKCV